MACGIYKITNLINGNSYIGQSVDIKRRWRNEKAAAFNEDSPSYNTVLSKAFRRYCSINQGKVDFSNFSFEILEECLVSDLSKQEQYYIAKYDTYNNGYNMTEGGDTPHTQILTKQQVLQIVECLQTDLEKNSEQIGKDFNVSGRMIRSINNGSCHRFDFLDYPIRQKYVSHPRNTKLRGSLTNPVSIKSTPPEKPKSKCPSNDILFKQLYDTSFTSVGNLYGVSATMVQKWLKQTGAPTKIKEFKAWYKTTILGELEVVIKTPKKLACKSVAQYSLTGELLHEFSSLNAAASSVSTNNYGSVHIKEVCENKRKSAYGFYWRYSER